MTTMIAVRLAEPLVAAIDALVGTGTFGTRTEVIRTAVEALVAAHEEAAIDRAIIDGYRRHPETDEERALAITATRALIEEEPW